MITAYQRDGAVLIKGLWANWVDTLRAGIDRNLANPSEYAAENLKPGEGGRFFRGVNQGSAEVEKGEKVPAGHGDFGCWEEGWLTGLQRSNAVDCTTGKLLFGPRSGVPHAMHLFDIRSGEWTDDAKANELCTGFVPL